jgi:hypothetical protein
MTLGRTLSGRSHPTHTAHPVQGHFKLFLEAGVVQKKAFWAPMSAFVRWVGGS